MPALNKIDHVHFYVKNRVSSELWYCENLDFQRLDEFESWIENGPLTIANGSVHLALFESNCNEKGNVAFSANAESMFSWINHLKQREISFVLKDHDLSWSMYFSDPDGNSIEITTYECSKFSSLLRERA